MSKGDAAWYRQQYESAAKSYASAWENSPGDSKVATQAATGYLLADQVPPAVQVLSQLRDSCSSGYASEADSDAERTLDYLLDLALPGLPGGAELVGELVNAHAQRVPERPRESFRRDGGLVSN